MGYLFTFNVYRCDCTARVSRKLYWADVKLRRIFVSEMNGTLQYGVVSEGLSSPRAVVVHPLLGSVHFAAALSSALSSAKKMHTL